MAEREQKVAAAVLGQAKQPMREVMVVHRGRHARVVVLAEDLADTPASTQTELQAIVDSVQIDGP